MIYITARYPKLVLVLLWMFISCRKETISAIQCRHVAFFLDSTNAIGKIVKTDTSIYWPSVCGEELDRFLKMDTKPVPLCGFPHRYLRLVIWK